MSQVQLANGSSLGRGEGLPILEVKNLSVTFYKRSGFIQKTKSTAAVANVSFEIYENETMSLVGESGCGKTTIARCITGLTKPTSGSITYRGVDVTKIKGKNLKGYRKEVQIAFQDPFESLNPRLDVSTFLSIPILRLTGERDRSRVRQRVIQLLDEVGLNPNEILYKLPHQLSGGEKQRVNIARALASNPKLLVLDEPVSMLDASRRLDLLLMLTALKTKRNLAILLITHDLATSRVMGGRMAIIYSGKLVETGPAEDVLTKPHHPYAELLLSATPRMVVSEKKFDYSLDEIQMSRVKTGCVFRLRCKYATNVCEEVEPTLDLTSGSRYVACHHKLN